VGLGLDHQRSVLVDTDDVGRFARVITDRVRLDPVPSILRTVDMDQTVISESIGREAGVLDHEPRRWLRTHGTRELHLDEPVRADEREPLHGADTLV
jgi:hypothetical protein